MRNLRADSFDAIVTDPPYGLNFMGKDWDRPMVGHVPQSGTRPVSDEAGRHDEGYRNMRGHEHQMQMWHETWAREALRVLKPGGHLLAFGGTRTYHRLACAVEHAGFEIRDSLIWLYGSGFPKSLDVSKAIDKARCAEDRDGLLEEEVRFCTWIREESGLSRRDVARLLGSDRFYTGDVQIVNTATTGAPRMARRGMVPTFAAWERARRSLPIEPPTWVERLVKDPPQRPIEHPGQWKAGRGEGTSGALNEWSGWGTALKPGHEPIVVARKPLVGTVAANALKHGTGALNVDACRIGSFENTTPSGADRFNANLADHGYRPNAYQKGAQRPEPKTGRWPANVLLSHTPDCKKVGDTCLRSNGHHPRTRGVGGLGTAGHRGKGDLTERSSAGELIAQWECPTDCPVRTLDEQSGEVGNGWRYNYGKRYAEERRQYRGGSFGGGGFRGGSTYADTGGASRFFYCAKASRAERDAGLNKERNIHPTVKPIELIRWLERLVTPPGGIVLDAFAGSGTMGCAAVLEGFRFVGIERDSEYAAIARARVRHWARTRAKGG